MLTPTSSKAAAVALALVTTAASAATALAARSDSTPVGPLPTGLTSTITTQRGELVAVALPHRTGGRVWRVAGRFNTRVIRQVGEADIGNTVVLTFKARASGTATIRFGLTKGETAKAYESRRFAISVR